MVWTKYIHGYQHCGTTFKIFVVPKYTAANVHLSDLGIDPNKVIFVFNFAIKVV